MNLAQYTKQDRANICEWKFKTIKNIENSCFILSLTIQGWIYFFDQESFGDYVRVRAWWDMNTKFQCSKTLILRLIKILINLKNNFKQCTYLHFTVIVVLISYSYLINQKQLFLFKYCTYHVLLLSFYWSLFYVHIFHKSE